MPNLWERPGLYIPHHIDAEVAARLGQAVDVGGCGNPGFADAVVATHVIPAPVFLVGQVVQASVHGHVVGDFGEAAQVQDAEAWGFELRGRTIRVVEVGAVYAVLFLDHGPAQQPTVVFLVVAQPEHAGQRVDAVERLAVVVVLAVGIGQGAQAVEALWCAEGIEVQATLEFDTLDGGVLDVVGLKDGLGVAGGDGVLVDEVAVLVIEHRHVKGTRIKLATQAGFVALALLGFEVGVGLDNVALLEVFEAAIQRLGARCTEAFGVLAVPGVGIVERVGHAEFRREAMPDLVLVVDLLFVGQVDGVEEFLGDVRRQPGVVVTHARQEGPVVPGDLILCEEAIAGDGRVREVAGWQQAVGSGWAWCADGPAGAQHSSTGRAAGTQAGDFLLLYGGAVGQQVLGVSDGERFIQLCIEDPLAFLIVSVAVAPDIPGARNIAFKGGLVGLGCLVIQAPFDVVHQQAVDREGVFQAEALTANGVVAGPCPIEAKAAAIDERAAHCAALVGVGVILVLFIRQAQARAFTVVPAQFRQHIGGANVFRVGGGALQAGAAVVVIGFGFAAVALAHVQQTVEVTLAACDGGGVEPAVIGRAETGLEACAEVLTVLDDVVRVEGVVADGTADGAAAVQHRGRAAQDFHALDDPGVDIVAMSLGIRPGEEAVGHFDAIDLGQDPVAVDAADVVAGGASALACAADRHAWLVTHQVADVVDVLSVQLRTVMDGHGAGYGVHVLGLTGGADGDLIQRQDASAAYFQHDVRSEQ